MPRKSDTAERVLEVADQLLQEGVRPTQQNVRERIGSGSISTINKALNEWWLQLGRRLSDTQQRPDLPEPVIETASRLWQQALGYAERSFGERVTAMDLHYESLAQKATRERDEYLTELQALRSQCDRLLNERERGGDEKQALQQQMHMLEGQVIRLTGEKENLSRELKQQEILGGSGGTYRGDADHQAQIELKVSLRLAEQERERQEKVIERLSDENAQLKRQLLAEEREAMSKRHALETVIAQQDVRYDQLLKELSECRRRLADSDT